MERLVVKNPETWTLADVEDLIKAKLPEGQRLEYKQALHLDTPTQKAEVAKDVSGLANAQGGLLFFGIEEDDSEEPLPLRILPLNEEGLQTRLEDILDSALEPKASFHAATVRVEGGTGIVMRVEPRSGNPMMVQSYGQHRYFRRRGTRTMPMSGTEVAESFSQAQARETGLHTALASLPLVARITRDRSMDEISLRAEGLLVPVWIPLAAVVVAAIDAPRPLFPVDAMSRDAYPEDFEGKLRDPMLGIRPQGRWTITALGLREEENYTEREGQSPGLIRRRISIFREGVVEWVCRYAEDDHRIPGITLGGDVHDVLAYAASIFTEAGYYGRLQATIRIENADLARPYIPDGWDLAVHAVGHEWVGVTSEVSVDELRANPLPTVRSAMDVIWQGFGVERCPYFDREIGAWIGSR
jgi:hypothetical protein